MFISTNFSFSCKITESLHISETGEVGVFLLFSLGVLEIFAALSMDL